MSNQFTNPFTNPRKFFSSQPGGFLAPPKQSGFQGLITDPRVTFGISLAGGASPIEALTIAGQMKDTFSDEEKDRQIVKGADGFNYFVDTGERVFPNVIKENDKERRIIDGADGFKYYADTGERVLPNVKKDTTEDANSRKTLQAADGFYYFVDTGERVFPGVEATAEASNNIKTVNNQIVDLADPDNPRVLFDGRDSPDISAQVVGNQIVFTNKSTQTSYAQPIEGFKPDESDEKRKDIEFYSKQYTGNNVVKNFNEAQTQMNKLIVATKDPSPAGDVSLIFTYMKILDPTSVVREGEQATISNTTNVPGQIRNLYNRLQTGERLNDAQREDFRRKAIQLFQSNQLSLDTLRASYGDIFVEKGLTGEKIFTDTDFRPKKIELDGKIINVPRGTLLIDYDPKNDTYIYRMPNGDEFQIGRTQIQ